MFFALLALVLSAAAPGKIVATAPTHADSLVSVATNRVDSASAEDSLSVDTLGQVEDTVPVVAAKKKRFIPPHYWVQTPQKAQYACREQAETNAECLRNAADFIPVSNGFPGTPARFVDMGRWETVPWHSPYQPATSLSPYGVGGLHLVDSLRREGPAFSPISLGEAWTPIAPLDTPTTLLRWQRGALAMNQFQVDLERALVGGSYVALSYTSQSGDAQPYDYSFNVTQPYLSGWGFLGQLYKPIDRDSGSLVLKDISPKIEANHIRPRMGFWIDTNQVVEVFYDRIRNRTQLGLPRNPSAHDSTFAPMESHAFSDGFGLLYAGIKGPWHFSTGVVHGSASRGFEPHFLVDTTRVDTTKIKPTTLANSLSESVVERLDAHLDWSRDSLKIKTWIYGESELFSGDLSLQTLTVSETEGWRDGQGAGLEGGWGHRLGQMAGGVALLRESRASNAVYTLPQAWAEGSVRFPLGFHLSAGGASRREDPETQKLYRNEPALNQIASPELRPRWDHGFQSVLAWDSKKLGFFGGYAGHWIRDGWAARVLPSPFACTDLSGHGYVDFNTETCRDSTDLPDTLALRWRNYENEVRLQALLGLRLNLGHWQLWLEDRFLVRDEYQDPSYLKGTVASSVFPARVFRGQLFWTRRLVSDRMRVITGWDWEWLSTRYAWASNLDGTSTVVKLDEYLVLDFYAAMQIKTFTLHFRAQNMNHDRYAPEPGAHPPGVNFRFGVDWALGN